MPWKVKAMAWNCSGQKYKTVLTVQDDEVITDEEARMILYWVRNMEPGEKVVIKRFHPGESG